MVADATSENVVMTGSDSVNWVAKLNVVRRGRQELEPQAERLLKINGKRQTGPSRATTFRAA